MNSKSDRANNEIIHGRFLSKSNANAVWGWGSPAGKKRASRRADMIIEHGKLGPGKSVLEIGCGTGTFTQLFEKTGARIVAVDISGELLEIAKGLGLPSNKVRFIEGRFEESVLPGPFDSVVGSSILHHLELIPALKQVISLLKPGGKVAFAEPNFLNPQVFLTKNIPWLRKMLGESPDETAFWPWKIARTMKLAGFKGVQVIPFDWLHPAVPEAAISPIISLGATLERLPLIKFFSGSLCIKAHRPVM